MPLGRHEAVDHDKMFAKPAKGTKRRFIATRRMVYFSIVKRGTLCGHSTMVCLPILPR